MSATKDMRTIVAFFFLSCLLRSYAVLLRTYIVGYETAASWINTNLSHRCCSTMCVATFSSSSSQHSLLVETWDLEPSCSEALPGCSGSASGQVSTLGHASLYPLPLEDPQTLETFTIEGPWLSRPHWKIIQSVGILTPNRGEINMSETIGQWWEFVFTVCFPCYILLDMKWNDNPWNF